MSSAIRWILFLAPVLVPAWAALSGVQYSAFGLYLAIVAATAVVVLLVMRMIGPASFTATDQDLLDSQEDGS